MQADAIKPRGKVPHDYNYVFPMLQKCAILTTPDSAHTGSKP